MARTLPPLETFRFFEAAARHLNFTHSDENLLIPAALGGLGVALARASLIEAELASRRLVRLFSRFGKIQVFQEWLLEHVRPVERKDAIVAQAG
jgi:DNA-binding transcriptional LysR family regulator